VRSARGGPTLGFGMQPLRGKEGTSHPSVFNTEAVASRNVLYAEGVRLQSPGVSPPSFLRRRTPPWVMVNLMREARNPQGSTPSFGRAPVVRLETCAHGARMWQPKNLTYRYAEGVTQTEWQSATPYIDSTPNKTDHSDCELLYSPATGRGGGVSVLR